MNELLGLDPDFPIFYLIPIIVFGPIFFTILYQFGLKDIINPSLEDRQYRQSLKQYEDDEKDERSRKLKESGLAPSDLKRNPLQWIGQGVTYIMFAVVIAYFSSAPSYQAHPPDKAEIRLSLTHPGRHKVECRKRTREELQKMTANMRAPLSCARERWPLVVRMVLDGELVFSGSARPAGLSKDGHSSFYEKFTVGGQPHSIEVRLWDGDGTGEPDYALKRNVTLSPLEVLVIGFDKSGQGLTLQ